MYLITKFKAVLREEGVKTALERSLRRASYELRQRFLDLIPTRKKLLETYIQARHRAKGREATCEEPLKTIWVSQDIEGAEEMLENRDNILVFMEIHRDKVGENSLQNILSRLEETGFTPLYTSSDGGNTGKEINSFNDVPEEGNIHLIAEKN